MAVQFTGDVRGWKSVWTTWLQAAILIFSFSHNVAATTEDAGSPRELAPLNRSATDPAQAMAAWAASSGDNQGLPFVVVDKIAAKLFVFDADGLLRASTSVLLGLARGDHSVAGIGAIKVADIPPQDRTTPAGRFVGETGKNIDGEDVVWIDYDAALAIHRIRPGSSHERRQARLSSPISGDKRVSYGCVVVPVKFYEQVIAPMFARGKGIVYVLPEIKSADEIFRFVQR